MIGDASLPPGFPPAPVGVMERGGVLYNSASWTGDTLAALARELARGRPSLLALSRSRLRSAWEGALTALLDASSPERATLDAPLTRLTRLSPAGLQAALESVLGGALRGAGELFAAAQPAEDDRPVLIVLAGNLPALTVQPLLPVLARRRPAILKSPSAEPLFAPALVATLARREPALAGALAAVTWKGGERQIEDPLLASVGTVLAYGDAASIESLQDRVPGRVIGYGPKTSLGVISRSVDPRSVAAGLARDVALFDQRGCLSIQALYTAGDTAELADALADALARVAARWPPGPVDPAAAAGVHQLRAEAEMRGLYRPELAIGAGTVVVEPLPDFRPSPGLRTVRIHPLPDLERLAEILAPWNGKLQGAALAGAEAEALAPALEALGVTRCARPGELQSPNALWHNGGVHPLAVV